MTDIIEDETSAKKYTDAKVRVIRSGYNKTHKQARELLAEIADLVEHFETVRVAYPEYRSPQGFLSSKLEKEASSARWSQLVQAAQMRNRLGEGYDDLPESVYRAIPRDTSAEQGREAIDSLMGDEETRMTARAVSGHFAPGTTSQSRSVYQRFVEPVQLSDLTKPEILNTLESIARYTDVTPKQMQDAIIAGLNARKADDAS